jgi:NAD(P)-dependent dehydrogenase (short-subunit alcohol dehydrogenase family)
MTGIVTGILIGFKTSARCEVWTRLVHLFSIPPAISEHYPWSCTMNLRESRMDLNIPDGKAAIVTGAGSLRPRPPDRNEADGGSITNMSSVAGLLGGHPTIAYPTTKGAIISFTKTMAVHHDPDGIHVKPVAAPGMVCATLVYAQGMTWEARAQRRAVTPLGIEGTGWDVGEAVLFLPAKRSRWITGTVLTVDAGLTATLPTTRSTTATPPPVAQEHQ